jgi:hypothetical protein
MEKAFLIIRAHKFEHSPSIVDYLHGLKKTNPLEVKEAYNTEWDVVAVVAYKTKEELSRFREELFGLDYVNRVMVLEIVEPFTSSQ